MAVTPMGKARQMAAAPAERGAHKQHTEGLAGDRDGSEAEVNRDLRQQADEAGAGQYEGRIACACARQRVAEDASARDRCVECGGCEVAHKLGESNRGQ